MKLNAPTLADWKARCSDLQDELAAMRHDLAESNRQRDEAKRQNAALLEALQQLVNALRVCSGKAWAGSEKTPKQWADSATASSPEPGDK